MARGPMGGGGGNTVVLNVTAMDPRGVLDVLQNAVRINGADAKVVITADHQVRGGKQLPLKSIVDEALALGGCTTLPTGPDPGSLASHSSGRIAVHERV